MERRRALLIINPRSRQGKTDLTPALDWLRQQGFTLLREHPSSVTEASKIIRARRGDADCVIVGGGDGTIREAAKALIEAKLPIGILPLGTANDLARTLGIPRDLRGACEVIATGHKRKIDIAQAGGKYFFNAAHIGLGARLSRSISPQLKRRWGALSYARALADVAKHRRAFRVHLRWEGFEETLSAIHIIIANGKHYGGGMIVSETARIDDHLLTVVAIAPDSLGQLIRLACCLHRGFEEGQPGIWMRWTPRVSIETEPPKSISADGELVASAPAEFSVAPEAVSVYCPLEKEKHPC